MAKVGQREVAFASSLIRYLGASTDNTYLLLAVIAWVRSESGQRYIGNNPLNIRNSIYASGYRQMKGNGHFALFANLDVAAKASAAFLKGNHGYGYESVIAAARRGVSSSAQQVEQAKDFLTAIAMSKWSADHYGSADGNESTNKLIRVWAGLTGQSIPRAWVAPKPPKPPPPKPPRFHQPYGSASNDHVRHEYIDPFKTRSFYEERPHNGDFVLPGDVPIT